LGARFRHDFSGVRVHTDAATAAQARALHASAFTVGHRIGFAEGRYRPDEPAGALLLAHELAHVVQSRVARQPSSRPALASESGSPSPDNRATEAQADRMARTALSGGIVTEPAIAAHGVRLQREATSATPPSPVPAQSPRTSPMAERLALFRDAGLLEAPFRPTSVPPFPPLPFRTAQAESSGLPLLLGGVAATPLGAPSSLPVRPPLSLVPPPEPVPFVPPAPVLSSLPWLAALAVLLYPSSTASGYVDTLNPITQQPYANPEEYDWIGRLKPSQLEYLLFLERARRLDATNEDEDPDPLAVPLPQPRPEESGERCDGREVPRRGGYARHDAYATLVSRSPNDYFAQVPRRLGGLSINYDGLTPPVVVWEVKVGHTFLLNVYSSTAFIRNRALMRMDLQKDRGLFVAQICGYEHLWSIPNVYVAQLLNLRWGGRPPVLNIPELVAVP
jgi:hypothetical protein